MKIYIPLAVVAVLIVVVFALFGMWVQIGADLCRAFLGR